MGHGGSKRGQSELEPIEERVYRFVVRVVKLVRALPKDDMAAQIIGRQLLRAATSIGANVEEALGAVSRRDFAHKMSIAAKEAREANYWLRLIRDGGILLAELLVDIIDESLQISKILRATVQTARQ
ncbi:MAG: four helix bundle protein [Anaerolineae bacterium]|nr:four helix bundle protein [Anaerolineae bacterium]